MRTPNLLQSYRNRRPINPKISYTKADNISRLCKTAEFGTTKKRKLLEKNSADTSKKLDLVNAAGVEKPSKPKSKTVEKTQLTSAGKSNDSKGQTPTRVTDSWQNQIKEFHATANQQTLNLLQVSPTR
jgi:hypothetical protein